MKKLIIAILSLLSTCSPSLAQTWAGTASNQWATATRLQDAVTTSVFTKIQPFYETANQFIQKDSALQYVAVYDDWHAPSLGSKASNQWVKKSDLVAVTPVGCGSTWDSLTLDYNGTATQYAYLNAGITTGTATLTYTAVGATGSAVINVAYGGTVIASTASTSTSGTLSVPYTYNSNYGQYVSVYYTSYNLHPAPLFNVSLSCIPSYPAAVTLTFGYCTGSTDLGYHLSGDLAPGTLNVSNLILNGYSNNTCSVAAGTATITTTPAGIGGNSSGSYLFLTTSSITGSYGHMVSSVTINGTSYTPGQSFAYGSQTITVQINNTSCTTISSMTCP